MPPRCLGSPPPQGEGRAGAAAPERGNDSAGASVSWNSGPSPSLRDTSPRRGERQEKDPLARPAAPVERQAGCLRGPAPVTTPHPSSGLRETPDATFPSKGKAWAPNAIVGRQAALPRMPFPGLLTRRPAKGAAA